MSDELFMTSVRETIQAVLTVQDNLDGSVPAADCVIEGVLNLLQGVTMSDHGLQVDTTGSQQGDRRRVARREG